MTECVILLRNPGSGEVISIMDDLNKITVFKNSDDAVAFATNSRLCKAWPYQIVELDEL